MLIGVAAETDPAETRVAATPETVKKFVSLGAKVAVAHGAGRKPASRTPIISPRERSSSRRTRRSRRMSCSRCAGRALRRSQP